MRLHIIDLGWVEYVTLHYVVSAGTGRLHLRKFLLPIVYNGLSATIFCVTRKIVHIATSFYASISIQRILKGSLQPKLIAADVWPFNARSKVATR